MLDVEQALQSNFEAVDFLDFYRDIFPVGSFEERGVYEQGKYNGIAVCIGKGAKRAKRLTVTDDLEAIGDMVASDDFCLMSPISYVGKSRKSSNARYMYALALDLDGIEGLQQWQCLMRQISIAEEAVSFNWSLPRPTYLVSSGTGVHLYYVFEKPIPMFANIVEQLEKLKRRLTWQAWTHGASVLNDKVQYESLFQGFRVVGTVTKNGGRCCAFRAGEKVTLEYLNSFVPEEYRVVDFVYKSDLRLSEAKEKYPDLTGKGAEKALVSADITVNKNMVPFDSRSAFQTSGIRLGTPAITTRGAKEDLMLEIAEMIETVLSNVENEEVIAQVRARVNETMKKYPLFAY